jgi:hypothetical protein
MSTPTTDFKKLARELAEQAVSEKRADLQAVLSNPYLQNAALGAGAGGLIGMIGGGKNKRRAMLDYALMGGLGGLGATAAKNMLFKPTVPPPAVNNAWGADSSVPGAAAGIASTVAGGYGGHKLHNMLDSYGKLDRAMDADKTLAAAINPLRTALNDKNHAHNIFRGLVADAQKANPAGNLFKNIQTGSDNMDFLRHIDAWGRPGNAWGGKVDEATDLLAAAAKHVPKPTPAARDLTGSAIRTALRRVKPVRGRFALPIAGALAVPALVNHMTSPSGE